MQNLSQNIVFRMLSIFTEVIAVGYNELLFQLRIAWLMPFFLPKPIRYDWDDCATIKPQCISQTC